MKKEALKPDAIITENKTYLFQKGKSGNPNGRPKGSSSKFPLEVKSVIADVFTALQNDEEHNLMEWAKRNPNLFYTVVVPKIIPLQLSGDAANPLAVTVAKFE